MSENEIVSAEAIDAAVTADIATYGPTCLEDDWRDDDRADDMRKGMRAALLASGYPQKVAAYRARLEVDHHYEGTEVPGQMRRVENPPDVDEKYDGIACRDETIRGLEERLTRLRAENEAMRHALNIADSRLLTIDNSGNPHLPLNEDVRQVIATALAGAPK